MIRGYYGKILFSLVLVCAFLLSQKVYSYADGETPYVIVSSYDVSDGVIKPGEEFTFNVIVKNVDDQFVASNVIVTVDVMEGINTIYPSVPQVFVGDLNPGEEREVSFSFKMSSSFRLDSASFYATIYSGDSSNSVILSAPVDYDDNAFSVLSKNVPESAVLGENISVSLYFRLRSETNLSNVLARVLIDGHEVVTSTIGNVKQGASKTQSLFFSIFEEGKHNVVIELEGTDPNGEVRITEAYTGNIDITEADPFLDEKGENEVVNMRPKRDYWIIGGSIGLIIILVIGIAIDLKQNRK